MFCVDHSRIESKGKEKLKKRKWKVEKIIREKIVIDLIDIIEYFLASI